MHLTHLRDYSAEFLHVKPGKGAAFVRSKLKNYITGGVLEKTFRAGESLTAATIEKRETQFSYQDGDDVSLSLYMPDVNLLNSHEALKKCHTTS